MRKLVIALGITSAAFAASTAWLAHELSVERELNASRMAAPTPLASPAALAATAGVRTPVAAASGKPARISVDGPSTVSVAPGEMRVDQEQMRRAQVQYSRHFLDQLDDPQGREELLVERKMMMRNMHPRLAEAIGLTTEEYDKLMEIMAQQQLDMQERVSRCAVDPACDPQRMTWSSDPRTSEIASLLGTERQQKLETYRNSLGEREAVSQLRSRLSDDLRLSDSNAESLITAMAEERDRLYREAAQNGQGMSGFGIGVGTVYSPDNGGSFEERYEAARKNSQRLRDRAAQYLNAGQMRVFNQMQDEALIGVRGMLRNKAMSGPQMMDGVTYSAVSVAQ